MSDDPLLTSLCGICHISEPKYKCPRCGAKTCSLACVKKHKNWSSCNGERDPTVFIPATQLRTDRGIDHDYNFLHKLERKVETADKIFTEERGILPQRKQDLRPNKRARLHKGQSRGKTTLGDDLRPWAKAALGRLRKLDINVEHAPYGMSRARENKTHYNHKLRKINWQVEWLLLDSDAGPTRILSKALDTTPLYEAFGECQWLRISKDEREAEKKAQKARLDNGQNLEQEHVDEDDHCGLQSPGSGTWHEAVTILQESLTCRWNGDPTDRRKSNLKDQIIRHDKDKYKFFLGNPKDPAREAKKLMPVSTTDALETTLKGLQVVEFPQIYVLPTGAILPNGYVSVRRREEPKAQSKKRKGGSLVAYDTGSDSDGGPDLKPSSKEEGEIGAEAEQEEEDAEPGFEFENEEQRSNFLAANHAGRLPNNDDTTSSSGSDSSDIGEQSDMDVD